MTSGIGRLLLTIGLTLATLVLNAVIRPETASAEQAMTIPLQCRLGKGAWQPCRMEVIELGSRWFVVVGNQRLEFVHDGRGEVQILSVGERRWRRVNSRWERGQDLCWDGVCIRGAIPLD